MLESIIGLGAAVLEEQDALASLIKKVPSIKNNRQQHICKFVFHTKKKELRIDVKEEMDDNSSLRYLHVGSVDGPRSAQWFATSTASSYILSELFPNLLEMQGIIEEDIIRKSRSIVEQFYYPIDPELAGNKKYRYILDIEKLGMGDISLDEIIEEASKSNKPGKKILELLQKQLFKWIQQEYGVGERQLGLYTVVIDGEALVNDPSYRQAVSDSKKPQTARQHEQMELECNVCGASEGVPADLSKMKIKYFTTNQLIFASQLKDYTKNLNICSSCMEKLQAGEVFLQEQLSTRIAGFTVYIIPHLVYGESVDPSTMKNLAQKLLLTVNMAKSIDALEDFRNRLEELKEIENIYYLIDFAFVRSSNAATKILRLVKDVRPSFFENLDVSVAQLQELANKHFKNNYHYRGGLEQVYYLTPIRLKQGNASSFRELLALYDALFTNRSIDKKRIIKNLAEALAICFYEKEGFNIRQKQQYINYLTLDGVFLLEFFKRMGCLKGGEGMDYRTLNLNDSIKGFMADMHYDEEQAALFLLGYLLGQVGNAQYRRASEKGADTTYKPVLNKINFNGIDKSKIIRLRSDVFNKLRQEKVLVYNERIFAECTRLMDKNINDWKMNKDENLFYVLSGYAFGTTLPGKKKGDNSDEQ
ncbi:TIGR02556 family CRISPR-associated protein [Syntrophomonas wolfei]|jgi:CRISPR-associated protein Csh1|uniref:TIGR02556 family CRISPR-associated protein n=1 Tax=Syntrophomonas wolfei TaxID=863 RepID=UPI0023F1857B|nr:TIGR02556 family CRISPR-associated protein [Syntrophomonas wolfei]